MDEIIKYSDVIDVEILDILLLDRTTKKNIKWCSDNYKKYGKGYFCDDLIDSSKLLGKHKNIIKPRIDKSLAQQKKRSKDMAEVFTPSWICNKQINLIDDDWFGYNNAFNISSGKSWHPTDKVVFNNKKTWRDYVDEERLEITCGEGPFLTSRYDAVSGDFFDLNQRIGFLDRKLRVINENIDTEDEWIKYAFIAMQRTYGFDYQGDNVLLTRVNLLLTFSENYYFKFHVIPSKEIIKKISIVISWNVWQMDGMKFVVPNSCHKETNVQLSLFGDEPEPELCYGCRKNDYKRHNGLYCFIKDWRKNRNIKFVDLIEGAL